MTEPSTPDPEWFEDPRFEDIFASWAESSHPPARDTEPGREADDDAPAAAEDTAGDPAGPAPERDGGGDAPDLWGDAGAGLTWDVPDPRRAWAGPDSDDVADDVADDEADDDVAGADLDLGGEGDPDQEGVEPEPPADTGPWARQRDDVIPERRRRRWRRRS